MATDMTTAFELVTPARVMLAVDARMVVVPGALGLFGVLPRHAPTISTLKRGVVSVYVDGQTHARIMVDGGVADVTEERCTVLAERAVNLDSTSSAELEAMRKDAEAAGDADAAAFYDASLALSAQ